MDIEIVQKELDAENKFQTLARYTVFQETTKDTKVNNTNHNVVICLLSFVRSQL